MKTSAKHLKYIEEWQSRNWAKVLAYKAKWRRDNPEKMSACREDWKSRNVERNKRVSKARYMRIRVVRPPRIPLTLDQKRARARGYYHKHRIKRLAQGKLYRERNPEKISRQMRSWRIRNRDHILNYVKTQYRENPQFAIASRLSSRLNRKLKLLGLKKSMATFKLIGCSPKELKQRLESKFKDGMSWENRRLWHIDHKRPCASFDLRDLEQQKACFHYSNLQPLWAKENMSKGSRIL